ncbi:hypothetical protein KR018_001366, partial [Drosophila ironensis]
IMPLFRVRLAIGGLILFICFFNVLSKVHHRVPQHTQSAKRFSRDSNAARERRPNIILILTDDQDVELGSLNFMPRTLRLLRNGGAEFPHAYTTTPMCCPARSSLLTGMYVHNHMVFTNNDNCSSPLWQATHETRSYATYLSNAGYRTGYFGKYLNKYNGSYIPPGWREWGGLIMNSKYYNYSINLNGQKIKHGFDYAKDYYPDLIANDSIAFLRSSKQQNQRKPVLLTMSFPAPHGPEDSAPQYSHLFFNVTTHHTPTYDHAPNPDKQWILRVTESMQPVHKRFTNLLMTKRLQTLQSVDVAVERVYNELKDLGELDNTYIIYTSDHGYHLGQFGLIKGKSFPFEFDVRVPFLIRGPGIPASKIINEIVLNVDLAPTFLDMGGVPTPQHMDGRSILPLLLSRNRAVRDNWPDSFLIESSGRRETAEQIAESRARLQSERRNMKLANSTLLEDVLIGEKQAITNLTRVNSSPATLISFPPITATTDQPVQMEEDGDTDDDDDDDADEGELAMDSSATAVEEEEAEAEDVAAEQLDELEDQEFHQQQINNLPLAPYVTKMMRLNSECSDPDLLKNCLPGQKWKCVNEEGRWRKHKCKFHLQIEHQLTSIPRKQYQRNCACFTPDGVVYTKIRVPSSGTHRVNKRTHQNQSRRRNKREMFHMEMPYEMEELLDLHKNVDILVEHVHRRKRGVTYSGINDTITQVMLQIQTTLKALEQKFNENDLPDPGDSSAANSTTNPFGLNDKSPKISSQLGHRCFVDAATNKVVCSDMIYDDEKTWRTSRVQIDMLIKLLKDKIGKLKELKKQLREHNKQALASNRQNENRRRNEAYLPATGAEFNMSYFTSSSTPRSSGKSGKEIFRGYGGNLFDSVEQPRPSPRGECYCEPDAGESFADSKEMAREARRKLKEERQRRKERKRMKKARLEKECLSEKMNCFSHDNQHWRTAPFWNDSPFCFCMNANNNTYSCLRTINATHNFLYCEFTTGLITFYNLTIDPFEMTNRAASLLPHERSHMHEVLERLKGCRGRSCSIRRHQDQLENEAGAWPLRDGANQVQRNHKRKNTPLVGTLDNYDFVGHRLDVDAFPPSKRRKYHRY